MILQHLLFPTADICSEQELYYRTDGNLDVQPQLVQAGSGLPLQKGVWYTFNTYLNGFSVGVWQTHTSVRRIQLRLRLFGTVQLKLLYQSSPQFDAHVVTQELGTYDLEQNGDAPREVVLSIPLETVSAGMVSFSLQAETTGAICYGGSYETIEEPLHPNPVHLALDLCTFRREAFILRNLTMLRKAFLDNPDSPLYGNLSLFIVDNAGTLDAAQLADDAVRVVQNPNTGGSGGFTRGMLEILHAAETLPVTHVLLMDDDILLDPEVLHRTYTFLSLLLPADQDAFLGGVMLTRDRPYWQVEFGARWNCGNIESLKGGYDVRQLSACLQNEKPEFADYQGWWYCAMPISVIRQDNLPLPLFVRMDDVEYGLRNMKQLILMNGICVWHEAFDKKYASSIFYYILRNQMIVNALYGLLPNRRTFLRQIFRHALGDMLLYRYDNVTMIVKGIQDYYKGPCWLAHVPAAKYNAQITKMGHRMQPLEQLEPLHLGAQFVPKQHPILKKLTLNGLFLPANHEAAVPLVHADFAVAFRARKLLHYDAAKTGGFVTKRSFWKAMQCFGKLGVLAVQTLLYAKKAQRAYLEQSDKFRTEAFWEQYLKENE